MSDDTLSEKKAGRRVKPKKQPMLDTRSDAEKEIDAAIDGSKIKEGRDKTRRRSFFRALILAILLLIGYGIWWLLQPLQGTMAFGICKTFLELNVRYPHTLYLSTVEDFSTSVRIWYVQTDSFGEYRMEPIRCFFKQDPSGKLPFILDKITIGRHEVEHERINGFNTILPVLFQNPPNLDLPWELPDSLKDLQVDPNMFRKPILEKGFQ